MARYLYRLGRGCYRHKWVVIIAWILLLGGSIGAGVAFKGTTSDSFSLPGLESTQAFDLIKERTPQAGLDGAEAQLVFRAPEGERITDPRYRRSITESIGRVEGPSVVMVQSPFAPGASSVSPDGRTAYATVRYSKQSVQLTTEERNQLLASIDPGKDAGLEAAIGGSALMEMPSQGPGEMIGVVVALVILVITFGVLVPAGLPIVTATIGVVFGISLVMMATGFMDLGSSTPILASMLGLAVGIDYALFIVSRYRHEVRRGRPREEAAGVAVGTAGSAVVFAGLTVIIALAGLVVVGIRFLSEMGIAAAFTVGIAVLIALTFLPALFGALGNGINKGKVSFLRDVDPDDRGTSSTFGRRWAVQVTRHRGIVVIGCVALAAVLAIPVASMRLALPDNGSEPPGTNARTAYDMISDGFGPGANGPLLVIVDTANARDPRAAVAQVTRQIRTVDTNVAAIVPAGPPPLAEGASAQQKAAHQRAEHAFDGQLALAKYATITVVPKGGPSSASTQDLVHDIRSAVNDVEADTGAHVYVTGQTALGVDISEKMAEVFPRYLGLVVALAFVLLALVFRSILVPLKAVLGFLVSVGVALGVTVAVFQWGWGASLLGVETPGPIMALLPILLVGIMFGLAMDYEVFLVSRMREEFVHGASPKRAVVDGFRYGARVVTAAALIMIGVFVSFVATAPNAIIMVVGFGLAAGILADAFLVRMTLVPAVMSMLGSSSWWLPRWLDRVIPNLDIEGDSLQRHLRENGSPAAPVTPAEHATDSA